MLSPAQTSLAYDHIPYTEIIEVRLEEIPRGIVERFLASFFSRHIGSEHFTRVRLRTASEARISWASQRLSRPFGLSTGKMRAFLRWFPPTRWNFSRAIWYLGLPAAEAREFLQRTPLWLKLIRRRP